MATIVTNAGSLILNGATSVPKGGYVCKIESGNVHVVSLCGKVNWSLPADTTIDGDSFADAEELLAELSSFSRGGSGPGPEPGDAVWGGITGDMEDQTDLSAALAGKANTADLGTAAAANTTDFAAASHTHDAAAIVSGTLADARIPSLNASKTNAGVFDIARIPTGNTSTTVSLGNHTHSAASGSTAGFMSAADKTKLDGVATGATANSSNATLLNRANHTGTQALSTVVGASDNKFTIVGVGDSTFNFGLTHVGFDKIVRSTGGGDKTWNIVNSSTTSWVVGSVINIAAVASNITITGAAGVNLISDVSAPFIIASNTAASLIYLGSNEWIITAKLTTA